MGTQRWGNRMWCEMETFWKMLLHLQTITSIWWGWLLNQIISITLHSAELGWVESWSKVKVIYDLTFLNKNCQSDAGWRQKIYWASPCLTNVARNTIRSPTDVKITIYYNYSPRIGQNTFHGYIYPLLLRKNSMV